MRVSVSVLNVEHVLLVVRCTWRAHRRGAYEAMFAVLFTPVSPLARLSQYVDALGLRDMYVCDQQNSMPKRRRMMVRR
jgi:hypothetical protein